MPARRPSKGRPAIRSNPRPALESRTRYRCRGDDDVAPRCRRTARLRARPAVRGRPAAPHARADGPVLARVRDGSAGLAGRFARRLSARVDGRDEGPRALEPVDRGGRRLAAPAVRRRERRRRLAVLVADGRPAGLGCERRRRPAADPGPLPRRRGRPRRAPDRSSLGPRLVARRTAARVLHARAGGEGAVRQAAGEARRRRVGPAAEGHRPTRLSRGRRRLPEDRLQPVVRGAGRRRRSATGHERPLRSPRPHRLVARRRFDPALGEPPRGRRVRPARQRGLRSARGGRRDPRADDPSRARRVAGPLTGREDDRVPRLRRPLPVLPGDEALPDEPRRQRAALPDGVARPRRAGAGLGSRRARPLLQLRRPRVDAIGVRDARRTREHAARRGRRDVADAPLLGRLVLGLEERPRRLHARLSRSPRQRRAQRPAGRPRGG